MLKILLSQLGPGSSQGTSKSIMLYASLSSRLFIRMCAHARLLFLRWKGDSSSTASFPPLDFRNGLHLESLRRDESVLCMWGNCGMSQAYFLFLYPLQSIHIHFYLLRRGWSLRPQIRLDNDFIVIKKTSFSQTRFFISVIFFIYFFSNRQKYTHQTAHNLNR